MEKFSTMAFCYNTFNQVVIKFCGKLFEINLKKHFVNLQVSKRIITFVYLI